MIHRTQDTYSLSHFRQNTGDHLKRLAEGRVETITQNGEAAMVVMSPQTYDQIQLALERGHIWDAAIERFNSGDRGVDAKAALRDIESRLGVPA